MAGLGSIRWRRVYVLRCGLREIVASDARVSSYARSACTNDEFEREILAPAVDLVYVLRRLLALVGLSL